MTLQSRGGSIRADRRLLRPEAKFLRAVINVSAKYGSNYPASGYFAGAAFWMQLILTVGLVSVILGTASGAQNVGIIGAFGVGGYIALAGLWGSPISGASMNPVRTFGPDLVSTTFTSYWVYLAGPIAGAVIARGIAFALRGRTGDKSAAGAAPARPVHRGLRVRSVLRESGHGHRQHGAGMRRQCAGRAGRLAETGGNALRAA